MGFITSGIYYKGTLVGPVKSVLQIASKKLRMSALVIDVERLQIALGENESFRGSRFEILGYGDGWNFESGDIIVSKRYLWIENAVFAKDELDDR